MCHLELQALDNTIKTRKGIINSIPNNGPWGGNGIGEEHTMQRYSLYCHFLYFIPLKSFLVHLICNTHLSKKVNKKE